MLPTIVIIALFIYFLGKKYRSYNNRKYELRLFRLRDRLRDAAVSGKIKKDDWTYYFLDSSISKMTKNLRSVNIFYAMYLRKKHINDKAITDFNRQLKFKLEKNSEIKAIYNEFQTILNMYLLSKHIVLLSMYAMAVYGYIKSIARIKSLKLEASDSIEKLTLVPETSTSIDFMQHNKSYANYSKAYC